MRYCSPIFVLAMDTAKDYFGEAMFTLSMAAYFVLEYWETKKQ